MKITSLAYSRSEDDPKHRKNPDAVRPAPSPLGLAALSVGGGGSSDSSSSGITIGTTTITSGTTGRVLYNSAAVVDEANVFISANTVEQRNSTNAQGFRIYNTYTDASNYERVSARWTSNVFEIFTDQAGTGSARRFSFGTSGNNVVRLFTNNVDRWEVQAAGHLVAMTDNTYDFGASGANRPRSGYFGTQLNVGTGTVIGSNVQLANGAAFYWSTHGTIRSSADGVFKLSDNAETSFGRLQFGGTSASFGAIGRDGAGIQIVGADGTSVSWIKVPGVTVASLPAAATAGVGARSFVTDASAPTFGATVTGGGAVATPVYSDGANWKVG